MLQPTRPRTPILALTAIAVGLLVVGGILLVGRFGVPDASPGPVSSAPTSSATDPMATPEGAVRAFFNAYSAARRTDDPAPVTLFVFRGGPCLCRRAGRRTMGATGFDVV
jgi:hypothetical protein